MPRLLAFALVALAGLSLAMAQDEGGGTAVVLRLEGAVTPATAGYVVRGIEQAAAEGAGLVVLAMDTPGGLATSMREIVSAILASPVPVATYVGPAGARAASAGTYILMASHAAAMAPSTHLGAATPVALGGGAPGAGDEPDAAEVKAINDAVAYIRGLAALRGRNADWAEAAVRSGVILTAAEAVDAGVADFLAPTLPDVLAEADGRTAEVAGAPAVLETAGLAVEEREPGLRDRFLAAITNPNVALLLMVFGFYGILFELFSPGALLPGVVGGISLLTGLYALSVLPVTLAGAGLMLLGLALVVAEAFAPSFGVLGLGGAVALTLGATLLFDGGVPGLELSWAVVAAVGLGSAGLALLTARLAATSHRRRVVTGQEQLVGAEVAVLSWGPAEGGGEGYVHVHGERWHARAAEPLAPGDRPVVTAVDGLTLTLARRDSRGGAGPGA